MRSVSGKCGFRCAQRLGADNRRRNTKAIPVFISLIISLSGKDENGGITSILDAYSGHFLLQRPDHRRAVDRVERSEVIASVELSYAEARALSQLFELVPLHKDE